LPHIPFDRHGLQRAFEKAGISPDFVLKMAEEALKQLERRQADIIEFMPDAILAIDLDGRVLVWNKAMERLTGVKADNMLGKENYEHALPFYWSTWY